jgi:hypothetical protein
MPLLADVAVAAEVFVLGGGLPVTTQGTYFLTEVGLARWFALRGGVMGGRARTSVGSAGFTVGRVDGCLRVSLGPVRFAMGCIGLAFGGAVAWSGSDKTGWSDARASGLFAPVFGVGLRVPTGPHFELATDLELVVPLVGASAPAISWGVGPAVRF